jgi:hypothetical protein
VNPTKVGGSTIILKTANKVFSNIPGSPSIIFLCFITFTKKELKIKIRTAKIEDPNKAFFIRA